MPKPWLQGQYTPTNPSKYVGRSPINYKSAWELTFCRFCDDNANVKSWAYESIKIPYKHPIKRTPTGGAKGSIYIPDFLVEYVDKNGRRHVELIEIKPASQTFITEKTSKGDRLAIILNEAKWKAAVIWCKHKHIKFRVLTKEEIYAK